MGERILRDLPPANFEHLTEADFAMNAPTSLLDKIPQNRRESFDAHFIEMKRMFFLAVGRLCMLAATSLTIVESGLMSAAALSIGLSKF
jgi:hypothetical protein